MGVLSRLIRSANVANPVAAVRQGLKLLDNEYKEDFTPRTIIDFADKANFMKWRVNTDAEIKGKSVANINFDDTNRTAIFEGNLDLTVDPSVVGKVARSGYAAIRSPNFSTPMDLQIYDSFELRAKGDGRVYVLNILPFDKYMEEDWRLFQVPIVTKPDVWQTIVFPFGNLMSSYRGKLDAKSLTFVGQPVAGIEWEGILMAQRQAGPFRLELDWLQAINAKERRASKRYDPNHV